ncbi:hypothetical protein PG996_014799 [Apiospora saccharicola]|uniref:IBR domain-containing protein n=1 Tax=Apiospora saccharicola TaxID=335842 RepID=A0ABR1TJB1_9PEZI
MGCDCHYCGDCLPLLFSASLNGGSFPAKCCGLPIDTNRLIVQALAGSELIQRHQERAQEEAAAAQARRGARDNADAIAVRAFARQQGWAECGRCGRIIDRIEGCNHITCPCSYEFCYACGSEWRACPCRQQPFGGFYLPPGPAPRVVPLARAPRLAPVVPIHRVPAPRDIPVAPAVPVAPVAPAAPVAEDNDVVIIDLMTGADANHAIDLTDDGADVQNQAPRRLPPPGRDNMIFHPRHFRFW